MKLAWTAACLSVVSCGGAASPPPTPEAPHAERATTPIVPRADIELREPHVAIVNGQAVPFDGIAEGLVWPALEKALGPRKRGDVVTVQVARTTPVQDLLRAAWTARLADLRVQSADAAGAMHAVAFGARKDGPPAPGCHLAVFVRPDGALRVAAPGGPKEIAAEHAAQTFARSLADERARCPIKYVAFGAESDAATWGPVFDVVLAVDEARAAGDARYVLGQAIHAPAVTQR